MTTLERVRAEIAEYGSIWVQYYIKGHTDTDIDKLVEDVLQQAKSQVLAVIDKYAEQEPCDDGYQTDMDEAWKQAKREPCDDVVSRQAALKELKESAEYHANDSREEVLLRRDRDIIRALPPVRPQPCDDAISRPTVVKFEGTNMACMGGDEIMKEFEPQESEDKE